MLMAFGLAEKLGETLPLRNRLRVIMDICDKGYLTLYFGL